MNAAAYPLPAISRPAQVTGEGPEAVILYEVCARLVGRLAAKTSLSDHPAVDRTARRRIEAVISGLIDALDELDGDPEAEPLTATETAGRGFNRTPQAGSDDDEDGHDREHELTDDNGIADDDGRAEQLGLRDNYGAWVPA